MKSTMGNVCLLVLATATVSSALVQQQGFSVGVGNVGAVMGIGRANATNFDIALNGQGAGPDLQLQGGGALMIGRATGRGTIAGFMQGSQVDGGQKQVRNVITGKAKQEEALDMTASQVVGKTAGGRGTATGMIISGGANAQFLRQGRVLMGQGSMVGGMQTATATGGPGSTVIVLTGSSVHTYQNQKLNTP